MDAAPSPSEISSADSGDTKISNADVTSDAGTVGPAEGSPEKATWRPQSLYDMPVVDMHELQPEALGLRRIPQALSLLECAVSSATSPPSTT